MRYLLREFIWVLLCVIALSVLPWWQAVLISAAISPVLLRLTERGFKRRVILLFCSLIIFFLSLHAIRSEISTAISRLFKLPNAWLLAVLNAGCFALVLSLAAESVLWLKFSLRRASQKLSSKG